MDKTTQIREKPNNKPVLATEKKACLVMIKGSSIGEIYKLEGGKNIVGCAKEAHIILNDMDISRRHLLTQRIDEHFVANDLNSTNGTEINDEKILSNQPLIDGDKICIADTVLKFTFYNEKESRYQKQVRSLIVTDDLTKIYNKRYFTETIEKEFNFAQRNHSTLSLVMFDIDHFKLFNDQYGHQAGDFMLTKIAKLITPLARSYDTFARFGGEEFVLLLRDTSVSEAVILANRSLVQYEMSLNGLRISNIN
jgi:diguanylate cyclase (GGDEF)-like protein